MAFGILNIAGSAMEASQRAITISSTNISGANDPNYTQQNLRTTELTATSASLVTTPGPEGMGVQSVAIQRAQSSLLDQNYRQALEGQQSLDSVQTYLANLQGQVTGSNSLGTLYSNATQALTSLETNPGDSGLQATALQNLQQLAAGFNTASTAISSNSSQAGADLGDQVAQVNSDLSHLASLNVSIVKSASSSMGLNQVLDQRDKILTHLSGLISTQVVEQANGTVNLYSNGTQLLAFNQAEKLTVTPGQGLQTSSGSNLATPAGGSVGGLQTFIQTTLPGFKQQYDSLASSVITKLNAISQVGYSSTGTTGQGLFSGTDAGNIAVALTSPSQLPSAVARIDGGAVTATTVDSSQSLTSQSTNLTTPASASGVLSVNGTNIAWNSGQSLDQILSSFSAAGVQATFNTTTQSLSLARDPSIAGPSTITVTDVSGNLSSVLGVSGLTSSPGGSGDSAGIVALQRALQNPVFGATASQNFQQAAQAIPQGLGQYMSDGQASLTDAQTALSAATSARQSLGGVNTNQELLNVTQQQNAFQMAAKVATAASDMLMTLIKM